MSAKVIVYRSFHGCETGCCGHTVQLGDEERFEFSHPWGEDELTWAKELVAEVYGPEHVADLDWENCEVVDD
jgi:hypothetical protein